MGNFIRKSKNWEIKPHNLQGQYDLMKDGQRFESSMLMDGWRFGRWWEQESGAIQFEVP